MKYHEQYSNDHLNSYLHHVLLFGNLEIPPWTVCRIIKGSQEIKLFVVVPKVQFRGGKFLHSNGTFTVQEKLRQCHTRIVFILNSCWLCVISEDERSSNLKLLRTSNCNCNNLVLNFLLRFSMS